MKKWIIYNFLCPLSLFCFTLSAENELKKTNSSPPKETHSESDEGIILFSPPAGWSLAESQSLPPHVRVMVVGKGASSFPPSMNLSSEPYKGTLKQYLKTVKNLNGAQGYEWKDLGTIQTQAGIGSLSQVDTKSQWGDVRLMHVILINNGNVYILTASALKDEFSKFYKEFFNSMRSLRVANDIFDSVNDEKQRAQLKESTDKLLNQWKYLVNQKEKVKPEVGLKQFQIDIFTSAQFQNENWKPFLEMLKQKYGNLGQEWQDLFIKKLEDQLITEKEA